MSTATEHTCESCKWASWLEDYAVGLYPTPLCDNPAILSGATVTELCQWWEVQPHEEGG